MNYAMPLEDLEKEEKAKRDEMSKEDLKEYEAVQVKKEFVQHAEKAVKETSGCLSSLLVDSVESSSGSSGPIFGTIFRTIFY